jgi:hypothetical protein
MVFSEGAGSAGDGVEWRLLWLVMNNKKLARRLQQMYYSAHPPTSWFADLMRRA